MNEKQKEFEEFIKNADREQIKKLMVIGDDRATKLKQFIERVCKEPPS